MIDVNITDIFIYSRWNRYYDSLVKVDSFSTKTLVAHCYPQDVRHPSDSADSDVRADGHRMGAGQPNVAPYDVGIRTSFGRHKKSSIHPSEDIQMSTTNGRHQIDVVWTFCFDPYPVAIGHTLYLHSPSKKIHETIYPRLNVCISIIRNKYTIN